MQEGTACTVYPDRPSICRAWKCASLAGAQSGEIEIAEARRRLALAREAYEEFAALRPEGITLSRLARAIEEGEPPDGMDRAHFSRIQLALVRMELLIDRFIRPAGQAVMRRTGPGAEGERPQGKAARPGA